LFGPTFFSPSAAAIDKAKAVTPTLRLSVFVSESKSNPAAIAEPNQPVKKAITALSAVSLINFVLMFFLQTAMFFIAFYILPCNQASGMSSFYLLSSAYAKA